MEILFKINIQKQDQNISASPKIEELSDINDYNLKQLDETTKKKIEIKGTHKPLNEIPEKIICREYLSQHIINHDSKKNKNNQHNKSLKYDLSEESAFLLGDNFFFPLNQINPALIEEWKNWELTNNLEQIDIRFFFTDHEKMCTEFRDRLFGYLGYCLNATWRFKELSDLTSIIQLVLENTYTQFTICGFYLIHNNTEDIIFIDTLTYFDENEEKITFEFKDPVIYSANQFVKINAKKIKYKYDHLTNNAVDLLSDTLDGILSSFNKTIYDYSIILWGKKSDSLLFEYEENTEKTEHSSDYEFLNILANYFKKIMNLSVYVDPSILKIGIFDTNMIEFDLLAYNEDYSQFYCLELKQKYDINGANTMNEIRNFFSKVFLFKIEIEKQIHKEINVLGVFLTTGKVEELTFDYNSLKLCTKSTQNIESMKDILIFSDLS